MPNRHAAAKTVTCSHRCMSTFHKKDTGHRDANSGGPGYRTNKVFSSRSYSTSEAKLNCWNCKQLLDTTPSFFCDSCKAIQPPEEGASYFRILDWLVSHIVSFQLSYLIVSISVCKQKYLSSPAVSFFAVTTHSHWTHISSRKDTCSFSGLFIQTTSARNLWQAFDLVRCREIS